MLHGILQYNNEGVIFFQSVILQCAQGVKNSARIRKHHFFRLNLCNSGAFNKILMDTYNSAMGYLGKSLETQTMEEHHQTFLKLFLKGKLREVIQFVYEREKGGVLQPEQLDEDKTGTINETVTSFLEVTQPRKTIPSCATLETYE